MKEKKFETFDNFKDIIMYHYLFKYSQIAINNYISSQSKSSLKLM